MKIDWKAVARSPGYRSLKAAYIQDVGPKSLAGRSKKTLYQRFQWVINRAKHYAVRLDKSLEEVLNEWESKRDCWWFGYYQETNQPKLPSGKPRNVRQMKPESYWRSSRWSSQKETFQRIRRERTRFAKLRRERVHGKKARWSPERKARYAKYREFYH